MQAAESVKLTWNDCGSSSTLAKVTSVSPLSLTLGETTTITGTGDLSKTVNGGTFELVMTGVGGKLLDCKGDASKPKTCTVKALGMDVGSGRFDGVKFPVEAGQVSGIPSIALSLKKGLPK